MSQEGDLDMERLRIFVSHGPSDQAFCEALAGHLRAAGADVWYDQQQLEPGASREPLRDPLGDRLLNAMAHEMYARQVFIVILSPSALDFPHVQQAIRWAGELHRRDPKRLLLSVIAQPIDLAIYNRPEWTALQEFTRVEASAGLPLPPDDAIRLVLTLLSLTPPPAQPAPTPTYSLLAQARALVAQERYDEALPLVQRATQQSGTKYDAWLLLGAILGSIGRYEESLAASERAIQLKPDRHWAWYNKGLAYNYLKQFDTALVALDRALALDDAYAPSWCERCNAQYHLGRHAEAAEAGARALALDPDFRLARIRNAYALNALDRNEEALAEYDAVLTRDPNDVETLHDRGRLLLQMKRHADALASYDRALALEAGGVNGAWGWNGRAYVCLDLGDDDEALRCVNNALSMAPDNPAYWDTQGELYLGKQAYEQALASFDQALALDPDAWFAWANKAKALQALGRPDEARAAARRARAIRPITP
jgi:tetratricopeptide (TPR) repeat protein